MSKKMLDYDVVILGGGPAGLSAAVYATRCALKTAIVDITMFGGQPSNYADIELNLLLKLVNVPILEDVLELQILMPVWNTESLLWEQWLTL